MTLSWQFPKIKEFKYTDFPKKYHANLKGGIT